MTPREWFWMYRPTVPSARAQSIQVVHAAHAQAALGHRVELCVEGAAELGAAAILAGYGLAPIDTLDLVRLPRSRTLASVVYRARFLAFLARTGGSGVVLARRKRHAAEALRRFGPRFHLLLEAHEVDSALAVAAGRDPEPELRVEREVLRGARGLICNAEGTLRVLREVHPWLPPSAVLHNGARLGLPPRPDGAGVGVVGSVRPYKDPETVAAAAAIAGVRVHWVGADRDQEALRVRSGGRLVVEPPVPPDEVPARLSRFRALLVPLSPGLFGEALTSPLKLWDALASGLPVVAADTPAIRAAAGDAFLPYRPGDVGSLVAALDRIVLDEALRGHLVVAAARRARTWGQRARELAAFVDRVLP